MASNSDRLVTTHTNSATDSKGVFLGLEGNQYIFIVAGVFLTIVLLGEYFGDKYVEMSLVEKCIRCFWPTALTAGYILCFVHNRKPHFQEDMLGWVLYGPSFNTTTRRNHRFVHPLKVEPTPVRRGRGSR